MALLRLRKARLISETLDSGTARWLVEKI